MGKKSFYVACTQNAKFQLKQNQKKISQSRDKTLKISTPDVWLLKEPKQHYKKTNKKPKQKQTKPRKKTNQTKATQNNPSNKNDNDKTPKPTITTAKPVKNTR